MSYDVALVGSGFSAICTAAHLLSSLPADASIAIVGDESDFGRGTAYRTELPYHRLNVPAGRMSVFPDRADDFLDWLRKMGLGTIRCCSHRVVTMDFISETGSLLC